MKPSERRIVKIKILDEINVVLIGLHPDHVSMFYDMLGYRAPNYFFNPKYKLGRWDGYIRFFQKTGKTYLYLLDIIIPKLKSLNYKIELIDKRDSYIVEPDFIDADFFSYVNDYKTEQPYKLRYYQVESVNSLIENGFGVVVAGTGAGKTTINAALVDVYGKCGLRSITIVPSEDLITQTIAEFSYFKLDVGEYSGSTKDTNHTHVISTWQALQNNPNIMENFNVVVVDECHGVKGPVLQSLLIKHGSHIVYRFGLTGTMPKEQVDIMSVLISVGPVQYEKKAHELIEENYLAEMHIDIYQLEEDFREEYNKYKKETPLPYSYSRFKDGYFIEYINEKQYLQQNDERIQWIKEFIEIKRDAKKGNVLCLVGSISFGRKLSSSIENAIFVYGKDKKTLRKQVYDLFETRDDLVVIATVHIAGVGLSINRIFNLMFIDVGKSFIRVIQAIGRGLRKAHDKDYVNVSDICSDLKYGRQHLRERIKYYEESKYPYKKHSVNYRTN